MNSGGNRRNTSGWSRRCATLYPVYKSAQLEAMAKDEARLLGTGWPNRQDIDKYREGTVKKARDFRKVIPLWNVVFFPKYRLPTADYSEPPPPDGGLTGRSGPHGFFMPAWRFSMFISTGISAPKTDLLGRFMFYHFSEYFHKFSASIPRAVVVGQWDIDFADGAFRIEEKQDYYGSIGKQERHAVYNGYCLPKGRNICFIMREAKKETPKFYMLEAEYDNPVTHQTEVLSGHMLKGSHNRKYFHSPVYAVRVPADKDVERDILRCEDVKPDVMHELDALAKRYSYSL